MRRTLKDSFRKVRALRARELREVTTSLFFLALLYLYTLYDYLLQLNRDAEDTFNRLVKQMAEREDVTEKLKADNQMDWVGKMNNIRQRATEIVNHDIIYN